MSSAIFERKIGAKMSGKIDVNAFYNIEYGLTSSPQMTVKRITAAL